MRYNDCVETAQHICLRRLENSTDAEAISSMEVIKQMFLVADTEGVLDSSVETLDNIKSWGDLEKELTNRKRDIPDQVVKLCVAAVIAYSRSNGELVFI